MHEMKDSGIEWIGEIPVGWETIRFKYLHNGLNTGEAIDKNYWLSDGNGYTFYTAGLVPIKTNYEDFPLWKYTKPNDLLLARNGTPYVYFPVLEACYTDHIIRATIKDGVNRKYVQLSLQQSISNVIVDSVSIPTWSASLWNKQIIPFPPLEEQHRISTYLDTKCKKIDSIIARQQEVIEKLKAYKLSVITEAVTKGLHPDVRMKESEIRFVDSFPEQWENRKMLSILSMRVVDGPHESPELIDEGIPYISATAIENGKINFELMRGYISEEYCNLCDLRYKPQKNDILVIKLGASTGQVAMVETDERFNIWVPLAAVRCNEQAVPRFVYYAFQSDYFIKQMELSWTFGTQQTLGVKTIERLRIIVPNVDEQQQIADYLDKKCSAIDSAIAKKQAIIEKLTAYKKSLIYEVVTGKREV